MLGTSVNSVGWCANTWQKSETVGWHRAFPLFWIHINDVIGFCVQQFLWS